MRLLDVEQPPLGWSTPDRMNTKTKITLSPHLRLTLAGFRLEVKNHTTKFKLNLKRSNETVATALVVRSGSLTNLRALHKAQLNAWGPTSEFYQALEQFADLAESLAARDNI